MYCMKIVATLLARDEEDIIEMNIRHHISEGIDTFIFTDNGSTDRTRIIAAKYPQVKVIIDEPARTHMQHQWVTQMARIACDFNPDWIVHLDADELWCNFKSLQDVKENVVIVDQIKYHLPIADGRYYLNSDDAEKIGIPPTRIKIIHRPDREIEVEHGNHACSSSGQRFHSDKIVIHHYPIRSLTNFLKKGTYFAEAAMGQNICHHWKNWNNMYKNGLLEAEYQSIVNKSNEAVKNGLAKKWVKRIMFL